jgi:NADPH:quinone reductase
MPATRTALSDSKQAKASAISPSDVGNVAGAFPAELPRVPGRDFAGMVVEGGGDEWNGKEVWGSGAGLGVKKDGSHAQYVAIPLDWLSAKPANLSMGEASAVGVPYLVSWEALVDAADVQSDETVLITGVADAVGHAATQIAHWMGATVIGADLGDKPSDADMSINTKDQNLDAEVKRLTNNKGVDLVLDAVGGPMFEPALKSLRLGGRQVAITSVGRRRVESRRWMATRYGRWLASLQPATRSRRRSLMASPTALGACRCSSRK